MVQRPKLKTALDAIGEWFEALQAGAQPPAGGVSPLAEVVFGDVQEGTLYFTGTEGEQYRHCLASLQEAVSDTDAVSARAVELAFQRALFVAFDIPKARSSDPRVRYEEALRSLEKFLTSPLQHFRVVVPVNDLAKEGLPTKVGSVTFAVFGEDQVNDFRAAATHWSRTDKERREQLDILTHSGLGKDLDAKTVAIVDVEAVDWVAAESRGIREVRLTLDVINFFGELVPYNYAHLSLPGDSARVKLPVAQLREEQGRWVQYHVDTRWVGSMGELSLPKLRDRDARVRLGFAYASGLLGSHRMKLQDRLVAALQWAGRAAVDIRKEEAFLLYAIALEGFILAEGETQELTYRLRLRVAHLLGGTPEARRDLFAKVKHLYGIRSKIVHSGHYQVTDGDFGLIRALTTGALVRVCTLEEFTEISTPEELVLWFETKLLGE